MPPLLAVAYEGEAHCLPPLTEGEGWGGVMTPSPVKREVREAL